jgi:phosphoesterase RecJ-like protein
VVVLDTGTWNQRGDFGMWLQSSPLPRAGVDHHRTQDDLGGLQMVDIAAEATGRLAYEVTRALGAPLGRSAAHHLFMAVATDTGWFRHPNTTPATFALCGELVALGANPTELYEHLYEAATLARFKLTAVALDRLATRAGGKIAFTEIRLADYAATGAVPGDTEDLINYPRGVENVEIALVFNEQVDGGTKVSFRSRAADVSKLAELFGGGGHKLASGARVMRPLPEVLDHRPLRIEELIAREEFAGDGDPRLFADRGQRFVEGQLRTQAIRVRADVGHQQGALVAAEELD